MALATVCTLFSYFMEVLNAIGILGFGVYSVLDMLNFFSAGTAREFDLKLRAFSAPFAQAADTEKVNEINHGGKVSSLTS